MHHTGGQINPTDGHLPQANLLLDTTLLLATEIGPGGHLEGLAGHMSSTRGSLYPLLLNIQVLLCLCQLSSGENDPSRDSIIIEFAAESSTEMLVNTIASGITGDSAVVALGFDCSKAFHQYSIVWTTTQIQ